MSKSNNKPEMTGIGLSEKIEDPIEQMQETIIEESDVEKEILESIINRLDAVNRQFSQWVDKNLLKKKYVK